VVQQLLELPAIKSTMEKKNLQQYGSLHLAAYYGHKAVAEVLLHSHQLSLDEINAKGQYPLHLASINGHEAVVKLLLNAKAPINKNSRDGYTALQLAAKHGHEGVVRQLVE
ncbi:ankyrin, partial [Tuber magnatum]